ncbi:MAG: flagellar biosynthesis protein FliQ [Leptolinea sp.]|jgi:flagellar biosynthetic protein FliQ|nr:flagellar biosynthesis protein FliQ [Leptolinea sp.]
MTEAYLISFAQNALTVAISIAGPVLIISLVIGSLISLVQAATQINEVTLTFVPKIIGIIVILVVLGGWMGQQIISFTSGIFNDLPNLVK